MESSDATNGSWFCEYWLDESDDSRLLISIHHTAHTIAILLMTVGEGVLYGIIIPDPME